MVNTQTGSCVGRKVTEAWAARGVSRRQAGSFVWILLIVGLAVLWSSCRDKASPAEVAQARKVADKYLDAWEKEHWKGMYELSTVHRIEHLTGIDPGKGTAFAKRAYERFALVVEQAKRYMGYERFEIEKVAGSGKGRVVFLVRVRCVDGKKSEFLLRLVRRKGVWLVD